MADGNGMELICKQKTTDAPKEQAHVSEQADKQIVCAACGFIITGPDRQIAVNQSFRHVFANPQGHVFEIGCFDRADGCAAASEPSGEFTWFPGFLWRVGVCRKCLIHLGWIFISDTRTFCGLIIDRLIFP